MDKKFQNQFREQSGEMDEVRKRLSELEMGRKHTEDELLHLRSALSAAERAQPQHEAIDMDDFDRAVDATLVRLRVAEATSPSKVEEAVRPVLDSMSLAADAYKV